MNGRIRVMIGFFAAASLASGCHTLPREAAVWRIPSCLAPAERVFVAEWNGWARDVSAIPALKQAQVVTVDPEADSGRVAVGAVAPWVTDEWLFGYRAGRPSVMQFPRQSGIEEWGKGYFTRAGWPVISPGAWRGKDKQRFDAGGNVIALPASWNRNASGCLAVSAQMAPEIKRFLSEASGSRLVELDTKWLRVGHVDEILSVLPCGPDGFRFVVPDAEAGLRLLQEVPANRIVFGAQSGRASYGKVTASTTHGFDATGVDFSGGSWRFVRIRTGPCAGLVGRVIRADAHRLLIDRCWDLRSVPPGVLLWRMREAQVDAMPIWFDVPPAGSEFVAVEDSRMGVDGSGEEFPAFLTVGELRQDDGLRATARQVGARVDGPRGICATLARQLGVAATDIIRLPVLFSGTAEDQSVTALVPNPVNLVVVGSTAILLKPFGPRADPDRSDSDVFETAWRRILTQSGVTPAFLDGWDVLHRLNGGVRCGMNVMRREGAQP